MKARSFAAALLLSALLVAPAVATTEDAQEYLAKARAALERGDAKTALIHARNALEEDPDSREAHLRLGIALSRLGELDDAERELRIAYEDEEDDGEAALALAELLSEQERFGELLDMIEAGDRAPEIEARVRAARGWAYLGLERAGEAERAFKEALARDPAAPASVRAGLAQARFIRGDTDEAIALLEEALAQDPKLADGWLFLGRIRAWRGDHDGARAALDKAIELAPRSEPVRRARALLALQQGADTAMPEVDALLRQRPDHPFGNYLAAVIQVRRQDWEGAEQSLAKIGKLEDIPPALLLSARVQLARARLARAEGDVSRYLAINPQDAGAQALYAEILMKRGNAAKAVASLEAALAASPDSFELASVLVAALLQNGEHDRATEMLDRLAAKAPATAEARLQLAALQARSGNPKAALSEVETARSLAPLPPRGHALAIASYLGAGRLAEAEAAAEAFRQSDPRNPIPENLLGYIVSHTKGVEEGRKHYRRALELDPSFAPAAINLAQTYRAAGDIAEARAELDRFLAREPDSLPALIARAELDQGAEKAKWLEQALRVPVKALEARLPLVRLLIDAGMTQRALELARELEKTWPNDWRAAAALGDAELGVGDARSAASTYARVLTMTSSAPEATIAYSSALELSGERDNARLALERGLTELPKNRRLQSQYLSFCARNECLPDAIVFARELATGSSAPETVAFLAELQEEAGLFTDAKFAWKRAIDNGGGPEFVRRLAQSEAKAGDLAAARDTIAEHLAAHPDDREARFLLASFAVALGDTRTAIAEHERLLASDPKNPLLLNNLAALYDKISDRRALELAEAAYRAAPRSPIVADTLGWILLRNGDLGRALPLLQQAAAAEGAASSKYRFAVALHQAGRDDEAREQLEAALSTPGFPEAAEARQLLSRLAR